MEYKEARIGWEEVTGEGKDSLLVLNTECGTSGTPGQVSSRERRPSGKKLRNPPGKP